MDIASVDLNLLVAFEALLAARSVTLAGARVGLSQPAMSAALGRLRALSGDPLFVRAPGGMLPTARAERLGAAIAPALAAIRGALDAEAPFEPRTTRRVFVVGASETIAVALLPRLANIVSLRAPGASIKLVAFSAHAPPDELARGEIDVALGFFREVPAGFRRRVLFRERLVCVVRRGHPNLASCKPRRDTRSKSAKKLGLTLEAFVAASHVLVSPRGHDRGSVDVSLAARGLERRVAVQVPHLMEAVALLRVSDLVLTVGEAVAVELAKDEALIAFEPPMTFTPFDVAAVWHERTHRDPGHSWLRAALYEASASTPKLGAGPEPRRRAQRRA